MALPREFIILLIISSYWIVSTSLVFLNKYLVGGSSTDDGVTLISTWVQCIVTCLIITAKNLLQGLCRRRGGKTDHTTFRFSVKTATNYRLLFMSCVFVAMLSFSNLCLKYIGVAFYQVSRSMTLIFTVAMSAFILKQSISRITVISCMIVAMGFMLGVDQENLSGSLSAKGLTYGIISSLCISANGILMKQVMNSKLVDGEGLTFYNNFIAAFLFIPILLMSGQIQSFWTSPYLQNSTFWTLLVISGFFSMAIGWLGALQVQYTSPITHHVSCNTKASMQTLIAVVYYHLDKTWMWWTGSVFVLAGVTLYSIGTILRSRSSSRYIDHLPSFINRTDPKDINKNLIVKETNDY